MRKPSLSTPGDRWIPTPWLLGVAAFTFSSLFMLRPENWYGAVSALLALCLAWPVVLYWSRQRGWSVHHQFALAAGSLLTYAWLGFVLTYLFRPDDKVAWMGNGAFALLAVMLIIRTGARIARQGG